MSDSCQFPLGEALRQNGSKPDPSNLLKTAPKSPVCKQKPPGGRIVPGLARAPRTLVFPLSGRGSDHSPPGFGASWPLLCWQLQLPTVPILCSMLLQNYITCVCPVLSESGIFLYSSHASPLGSCPGAYPPPNEISFFFFF